MCVRARARVCVFVCVTDKNLLSWDLFYRKRDREKERKRERERERERCTWHEAETGEVSRKKKRVLK